MRTIQALALAVVLAFAACGGGGDDGETACEKAEARFRAFDTDPATETVDLPTDDQADAAMRAYEDNVEACL